MKKQKFELSHDIIAEKVWARLPEQDKQLRMIQASIRQRREDYAAGKGSLLGKAELEGWGIYMRQLELSEKDRGFWNKSLVKFRADQEAEANRLESEKKQLKRNQQLQKWIGGVLGLVVLISVIFIWRAVDLTHKANIAISDQKVAEAKFAFQDQHTQRAFRLVQKALVYNPDNESAKKSQRLYLDYLGIIQRKEVIDFTLSPAHRYIACLVQQNDSVVAQVFALEGSQPFKPVITSKKLAKSDSDSYSYRGSYRFSGGGGHIAFLCQQNDSVVAQVFALEGSQPFKPVITSKKLAKSDSDSDRYCFSGGGGHIAFLCQQNDSVVAQVFALEGSQPFKPVITSKKLAKSDSESYRFSGGGGHIAFLYQQNDSVVAQVFALEGSQPFKPVITSKKLAKSDSYRYRYSYSDSYRFSGGGGHIAFLCQQNDSVVAQVFALKGSQPFKPVITSKKLAKSDSYRYRYSYSDSYRFSGGGGHIAFLYQQNDSVVAQVFALEGSQPFKPVITSKKLAKIYSYSYRYSYRFSGGGGHIAFLCQQNDSVVAQVFALEGSQPFKPVITSKKLAKSYSESDRDSDIESYSDSYSDSYRFSGGGGHIAFLCQQNDSVVAQVFALKGSQPFKPVITSKKLAKSGFYRNYGDSYRFSGGGGHIAFLCQQNDSVVAQVFALEGSQPFKPVITSKKLAKSDSYSYSYRFSGGGGHIAFLCQQNDSVVAQVFALEGSQPFKPVITSKKLAESGLSRNYGDSYRFFRREAHIAFLTQKEKKKILTTYSLDQTNIRSLEGIESIGADYEFIPESNLIVYRTEDKHLKVVDVSIPQDSLIDYYDRVLPTLAELEAMED